ncbi:hypothetical protein [Paraburkholderia domus]|uniref:Uncharacterized protein n=1 Tax=Paraburkholderia domus TaxID=2793075 RepID=A0A9N8N1L7_9BURK|nr:hypothetical protein [Paraburkholderia domus]MBK5169406.1 hypothetical protein [Burkholderia sp. R-70211]CAE6935807.1 hypothetical protein R70211_05383 [Paraburkholderia domus]
MESNNTADVFRDIYLGKKWHSAESVSGWGSEQGNTERFVRELPDLASRYNVTSVLDVPCGDFNWMRHVDLGDIDYIGADFVAGVGARESGRPWIIEAQLPGSGSASRLVAGRRSHYLPGLSVPFFPQRRVPRAGQLCGNGCTLSADNDSPIDWNGAPVGSLPGIMGQARRTVAHASAEETI